MQHQPYNDDESAWPPERDAAAWTQAVLEASEKARSVRRSGVRVPPPGAGLRPPPRWPILPQHRAHVDASRREAFSAMADDDASRLLAAVLLMPAAGPSLLSATNVAGETLLEAARRRKRPAVTQLLEDVDLVERIAVLRAVVVATDHLLPRQSVRAGESRRRRGVHTPSRQPLFPSSPDAGQNMLHPPVASLPALRAWCDIGAAAPISLPMLAAAEAVVVSVLGEAGCSATVLSGRQSGAAAAALSSGIVRPSVAVARSMTIGADRKKKRRGRGDDASSSNDKVLAWGALAAAMVDHSRARLAWVERRLKHARIMPVDLAIPAARLEENNEASSSVPLSVQRTDPTAAARAYSSSLRKTAAALVHTRALPDVEGGLAPPPALLRALGTKLRGAMARRDLREQLLGDDGPQKHDDSVRMLFAATASNDAALVVRLLLTATTGRGGLLQEKNAAGETAQRLALLRSKSPTAEILSSAGLPGKVWGLRETLRDADALKSLSYDITWNVYGTVCVIVPETDAPLVLSWIGVPVPRGSDGDMQLGVPLTSLRSAGEAILKLLPPPRGHRKLLQQPSTRAKAFLDLDDARDALLWARAAVYFDDDRMNIVWLERVLRTAEFRCDDFDAFSADEAGRKNGAADAAARASARCCIARRKVRASRSLANAAKLGAPLSVMDDVVSRGGVPNWRDRLGRTSLHLAAGQGHGLHAAHLIKQHGADMNAQDVVGQTPLHTAMAAEQTNAALMIRALGASVDAKTDGGFSPLELAASVSAERRLHKCSEKLLEAAEATPATSTIGSIVRHQTFPLPVLAEDGSPTEYLWSPSPELDALRRAMDDMEAALAQATATRAFAPLIADCRGIAAKAGASLRSLEKWESGIRQKSNSLATREAGRFKKSTEALLKWAAQFELPEEIVDALQRRCDIASSLGIVGVYDRLGHAVFCGKIGLDETSADGAKLKYAIMRLRARSRLKLGAAKTAKDAREAKQAKAAADQASKLEQDERLDDAMDKARLAAEGAGAGAGATTGASTGARSRWAKAGLRLLGGWRR